MSKEFWFPLLMAFSTMLLFYLIGYVVDSEMLIFKISSSYTEISLMPIVFGLLVGFITEKIVKKNNK